MLRVLQECDNVAANFSADPVHDLRVSLRRCRSLADGMIAMDPDPSWKEMKKAGKALFQRLGELLVGRAAQFAGGDRGARVVCLGRCGSCARGWRRGICRLGSLGSAAGLSAGAGRVAGRRLRLRYITQVNTRPPTFALFASRPGELPDSYRRYLVNTLRRDFDLPGTPIRMMLRKGQNPYAR